MGVQLRVEIVLKIYILIKKNWRDSAANQFYRKRPTVFLSSYPCMLTRCCI